MPTEQDDTRPLTPEIEGEPVTFRLDTAPPPMTAEAMLQALIKTNQSERDIVQSDINELTQEAKRLDTIREGLEAALRAARSAALRRVVPSGNEPPSASPAPIPSLSPRG